MDRVTPTADLKRALDADSAPVLLVDAAGATTHVVMPIDDARRMFDDYLRRELKVGFDQADRGEVVDWEPDRIKSTGRELLGQRRDAT